MTICWKKVPRSPGWPRWAVCLVLGWLSFVSLGAWLERAFGIVLVRCWFKTLLHIPCPACGLTRSGLSVLGGNLWKAFLYNPFWVLVIGMFLFLLCVRLACGRWLTLQLTRSERIAAWIVISMAFMANWAYLICDGR
ncbi:MAG: DUF2752 domain-containing protein [Phycisphaerae bacterium]